MLMWLFHGKPRLVCVFTAIFTGCFVSNFSFLWLFLWLFYFSGCSPVHWLLFVNWWHCANLPVVLSWCLFAKPLHLSLLLRFFCLRWLLLVSFIARWWLESLGSLESMGSGSFSLYSGAIYICIYFL